MADAQGALKTIELLSRAVVSLGGDPLSFGGFDVGSDYINTLATEGAKTILGLLLKAAFEWVSERVKQLSKKREVEKEYGVGEASVLIEKLGAEKLEKARVRISDSTMKAALKRELNAEDEVVRSQVLLAIDETASFVEGGGEILSLIHI